jgi:hypothetical protein
MLTFTEFQATRREVADLGAEVGDYWEGETQAGFIYSGGYYIERNDDQYVLQMFNESYTAQIDGIETLERELYSLYASENGGTE